MKNQIFYKRNQARIRDNGKKLRKNRHGASLKSKLNFDNFFE